VLNSGGDRNPGPFDVGLFFKVVKAGGSGPSA
jgi:hypothetical protein